MIDHGGGRVVDGRRWRKNNEGWKMAKARFEPMREEFLCCAHLRH